MLDRRDAALDRLVGEEGVEDDVVESSAAEFECVRPEGNDRQVDVFVEGRVESEHGVFTDRAVVANDCFSVPQASHHPGEVLHLSGRDAFDAVRIEEGSNAATNAE